MGSKKYLYLIQNSLTSSFSVNDIEIPTDKIKNVATTFAYIFELNYNYSKYEKELKLLNSHKKEKNYYFNNFLQDFLLMKKTYVKLYK